PTEFGGGLGDRRDGRCGVREPGDVVEGGQTDVVGYPQAALTDRIECPQSHEVVGGKDHVGALGQVQEVVGGQTPAPGLEVAPPAVGLRPQQPGPRQCCAESLHPLPSGGRCDGPGDDGEPAVPEGVQVGDQVTDRLTPVRTHHGGGATGDPAVDEDDRGGSVGHIQGEGGVVVRGGDEQAVDTPRQERTHVVALQFGALVGVPDDAAVSEFPRLLLHGPGELCEVGVEDVADDEPDG